MKSPLHRQSPYTLLWIIACANMLLSAGFVLAVAKAWLHPEHQQAPFMSRLPMLLMIVFGYALSLLAEAVLRSGIAEDRWTEDAVAHVRRVVLQPALTWFFFVLFIASLVGMINAPRGHGFGLFWIFFGPTKTIGRVRAILRSQTQAQAGFRLLDPAVPQKPLRSDHWGASTSGT